ncbi:hypothetical protein AX16_006990 [Volvariella volvacea WC 439]|nr:hypothetical protein AX16_006990 [Volvariella volvacea WC 439]
MLLDSPKYSDSDFSPSSSEPQSPFHKPLSPAPTLMLPITRRGHKTEPSCRIVNELSDMLAPLVYLQNIAPVRRHPIDEKALMALRPRLTA